MGDIEFLSRQKPVVAILGRPNVGKSTLFNRLVGRRLAIVEDIPGVTRDRNYTRCQYGGQSFTLVDTGGLDPTSIAGIVEQIRKQTEKVIEEADVLIVMFDGREGITALDEEIVSLLRKFKKPVFYVVNKLDTPKQEMLISEFHRLGVKPIVPVSAEQGIGVDELMEEVLETFEAIREESAGAEAEPVRIPRIAVVGRPNVGKSTFINRLLGEDRLITDATPGTTRDAVDTQLSYEGRPYLFIDTAGIRRRGKIDRTLERYSIARAFSAIDRCDIAVVILDAGEGIVEQDTKIVGRVIQAKRGCIFVVNKWDLCKEEAEIKEKVHAGLQRKFKFIPFAPFIFISALAGFRPKKIFKLLDEIIGAYTSRISTGELNRAFEKATTSNPPPLYKGKTAKLYYITQARAAPPTFVIFSNDPRRIKEPYRRYLENFLREAFGFVGSPLELIFRQRRS